MRIKKSNSLSHYNGPESEIMQLAHVLIRNRAKGMQDPFMDLQIAKEIDKLVSLQ